MKKADVGVAAYIVAAFVMLIVPIPSWLLDVLLACNIAIAFTILFTTMFSKEVLDMSFFPTILLFTTIFRIALNVSSTRLILTTGDPGQVVATFGSFVGGGDLIVGAIVFLILLIVQFMVINKGSERVAEVTARFTLDAMPGKQMAIDADLNTGAINDAEAKRQDSGRSELLRIHGWCGKVRKGRCNGRSYYYRSQCHRRYRHGCTAAEYGYYSGTE